MNERVRILRKMLGLTLQQFGDRIGISNPAVSMIESGKNAVTDRTVKALVHEFGVSETWLRTGEGEMFPPKSVDEELSAFVASLIREDDAFKKAVVSALSRFTSAEWQALDSMLDKLSEAKKKDRED